MSKGMKATLFTVFSLVLASTAQQCDSSGAAGALYTLSNHPTGNYIVISQISANGTVSFAGAVSAGGNGSQEALPPPLATNDPLLSQGSLVVAGTMLYAVNAGSNSIGVFTIDPKNPTRLTKFVDPVPSGGDFPVSLAVSPTTGNLCVANTGVKNNVQCFTVSDKDVTPIPNGVRSLNLNQTSNPPSPANSFSQITFTADGEQLVAAIKVLPTAGGSVEVWDVGCDGSFTGVAQKTVRPGGGGAPFAFSSIPGHPKAFVNADPAGGWAIYDFSKGFGDAGVATPLTVPNVNATCWTAYSEKTKTFFISDGGTGAITEVKVDGSLKGSVVKQYNTTSHAALDEWIGTIAGKEYVFRPPTMTLSRLDFSYLWTLGADITSVLTLSLPSAGNAQQIQTYNLTVGAKEMGIPLEAAYIQGMAGYISQ